MKYPIESFGKLLLSPLREFFQEKNLDRDDQQGKTPFRSELFSMDQMVKLAQSLASEHRITLKDSKEQLLSRLGDNEAILTHVITLLKESIKKKNPITSAGEWLLDNFYLIEEQIQLGKRYLPKGYSKGLPKLVKGDFGGLPRVYDIVIEIISHSDGHVDIHMLNNFISAYQKITELSLGELWAIPIMLRLALLENLRRVATRIAIDRMDADLAHHWANKIIEIVEQEPAKLILTLADMARSNPPLESAFVAEFNRKLQWKGTTHALPLSWVEQRLSESNLSINALVLAETQKQAADQVSITNSINSLRLLAKLDWRDFVESISLVEHTLREDLNGIYSSMDFFTRDNYRHQVEKIAKHSRLSERDIAKIAINLAKENGRKENLDKRYCHVGYFLVGKGREVTEGLANIKLTFLENVIKNISQSKGIMYFLGMSIITFGLTAWFMNESQLTWNQPVLLIAVFVIVLLSSSYLASSITNWITSLCVSPKPLPKLDFSKGIPDKARTLVIVPTIITGEDQTGKIIEDLEVRYLANKDQNLLLGILTDLKDSKEQINPGDKFLEELASKRITELNEKYCTPGREQFFLFHRPRQWNEGENVWMGYERKRGKLAELNSVLRGKGKDKFSTIVGPEEIYTSVKYVITLDTDTQLPRDSAWKLVGLMEHPLNHPQFDKTRKRVTEGYGIIQPRIAISLHGATRSLFSKLYENDIGIDPYTRIVSDLYNDIFHEASFIGKGIYQIDAFEKSLNQRFPENRILSHDLLEGCYTRCGFASDVQLYEEYPSNYLTDINRRHRWIRGDWQIGNWYLPMVPGFDKKLKKNSINALSRWKIFDNLRRSAVPVTLTIMLLVGWTQLKNPLLWTISVTLIVVLPSLLTYLWNILKRPDEVERAQHFRNVVKDTSKSIFQSLFSLLCLPHEAMVSMDAMIRSLWRMYISKKNLLQWNPSGTVQKNNETILMTFRKMWFSPAFSLATTTYLLAFAPFSFPIALPFLAVWLTAPYVVFRLSKPFPHFRKVINENQKLYLRELSRKTWGFFENLVSREDHWLPPDNIQQYPIPVIAHRTSPTNIGMSLLANLAAYDFGYITPTQLIQRTSDTFQTLRKLERFEGHFLNWYDTQSIQPLHPKYVSTVDSGNLAGHLLTLRQGLFSQVDEGIINHRFIIGLYDVVRIIRKLLSLEDQRVFNDLLNHFKEVNFFTTVRQYKTFLDDSLERFYAVLSKLTPEPKSDAFHWLKALEDQLNQLTAEVNLISFWSILKDHTTHFENSIPEIPTLRQLALLPHFIKENRSQSTLIEHDVELKWIEENTPAIQQLSSFARDRISTLSLLAEQCYDFADMQYDFLYDKSQRLLSIGYSVDHLQRDSSFYDLLASEARLSAFVGIAQGKLPQESWFALGRRLTNADHTPTLLSWSGSMFEYLMPLLVMPTYENTLLDETYAGNITKQIQYGKQQRIPWGISESCYNMVDIHLTYQYKAFGVPELGFKRGLDKDLVIAPYATVMALMVDPLSAIKNLEQMQNLGYEGRFGFFEAVDYTPSRLPKSKTPVLIQTFMAHHEGMSLLALNYLINDQVMQKRFAADPQFQTALLLLQERVPKTIGYYKGTGDNEEIVHVISEGEVRVITNLNTPVPEIQLLSNGKYHLMITSAGGGYSRWKDIGITRWREDSTRDHWGAFCYIRDFETGEFWSTTFQPTLKKPDQYETIFSQGRAEFRRRDGDIECHTEIVVSPEDDIEIRRIRLTNHSASKKVIDVTSYSEVVIALPITDAAHPAFSNLFVQTEINKHQQTILCTRRPRSNEENPPWMFQLMKLNQHAADQVSFETDRMKFIGRGRNTIHPAAMDTKEGLDGSEGSVLDPIVSIQFRFTMAPGEKIVIDLITGISGTRESVQQLIDKYQDSYLRDRAFDLSWTHSQVVLRQINATESHAQLYSKLASSIVYNNQSLRAKQDVLLNNHRGQSALWSYSISGDLPIILFMISETENIFLAKQLIQARAYWQLKGLTADLVILNEDRGVYRQVLLEQIQELIKGIQPSSTSERQGAVFVRSVDQISTEDYILLQTVAKVVISDLRGSLEEQISRVLTSKIKKPFIPHLVKPSKPIVHHLSLPEDTLFKNGYGGFSPDGREYLILTDRNSHTPLPWVNVIANKDLGTIVSESGPSYTWYENAQMFRLTPWSNDSVTDTSGEAYYIRDEDNGRYWSPMPWPAQNKSSYITRHGFGYTKIENQHDQIYSETNIFVDIENSIRFTCVKIKNKSSRKRKLSVAGYIEWILGSLRQQSVMHVVTERDPESGAIIARNPFNSDFPNVVGFIQTDHPLHSFTCDRKEFIGRNGSLQSPSGLNQIEFTGKTGAGLDPCTAYLIPIDLQPGQEIEIIFRIGAAKNINDARSILNNFKGVENVHRSFEKVIKFWENTLGSIQIDTPDPALNILTNGWLLYQVLSCRFWGRSGFYQSGGAYGYRDQLQDAMALVHSEPGLTRDHILLSASRQFIDGDVQHWWHPPINKGVRTLCSDDFLWLPYVTSKYIKATNDTTILDETISFIDGRPLHAHEESYYDLPLIASLKARLYDHCKLSLQRALKKTGIHGLPLIGSGDWNDGMNMVGIEGKGESIWLGFFLYDTLNRFIPLAKAKGDELFITEIEEAVIKLKINLNKNGWGGEWYLRAYFDNGDILGSPNNDECKIDSISQSWSVLSEAGEPDRIESAMKAVDQYLVNRKKSLLQLLEPPFNTSHMNPGYIKGYVPGVRENGGQYTHAAIWMIMGFAKMGDQEKTWELLQMINPINHGNSVEIIETYKVEPYVMAADVYGVEPHVGRGGWTWYTGSAGWMYQLIIESFLGIQRQGNSLKIKPCIPKEWKSFQVTYRFGNTNYQIQVTQNAGLRPAVKFDNDFISGDTIDLLDDHQQHAITIFC
ncbi:MAG: glucoamylase family protein [Cyclobacteriaceae bacterium]